jgi:hypothetical protein
LHAETDTQHRLALMQYNFSERVGHAEIVKFLHAIVESSYSAKDDSLSLQQVGRIGSDPSGHPKSFKHVGDGSNIANSVINDDIHAQKLWAMP